MTPAVLDANVLFAAVLRDTLVQLAVSGVYRAHWTEQIHEEWMRNVLLKRESITRAQLERTRFLMKLHLPQARVEINPALVESLILPDPDDRHVLAAAIVAQAEIIVTFNLADFPAATLKNYGVRALSPDAFLLELFPQNSTRIVSALAVQRARLRNPPQSPAEFTQSLARQGLTQFAAALAPFEAQL